jgi:hypothetical protein
MVLDGLSGNHPVTKMQIGMDAPRKLILTFAVSIYNLQDSVSVTLHADPEPIVQASPSHPDSTVGSSADSKVAQGATPNELAALHKRFDTLAAQMEVLSTQIAEIKQKCQPAAVHVSTPANTHLTASAPFATALREWMNDQGRIRDVDCVRITGNRVYFDGELVINLALEPGYPIGGVLRTMQPKALRVEHERLSSGEAIWTPMHICAFLQDGIAEVMSITGLIIHDQPIETIAAIARLPNLVRLNTTDCKMIKDMIQLRMCTSLRHLIYSWSAVRPKLELPGVTLGTHLY